MLKKWQRVEISKTLTALSQVVEDPLEYVYTTTNDRSKIVSFDKYNTSIVLTDDEVIHNLRVYTTKLMNKLSDLQNKVTYTESLLKSTEIKLYYK